MAELARSGTETLEGELANASWPERIQRFSSKRSGMQSVCTG